MCSIDVFFRQPDFFCFDTFCSTCYSTSLDSVCLTDFYNCDTYGWSWQCSFTTDLCLYGNEFIDSTVCTMKNQYPNCPLIPQTTGTTGSPHPNSRKSGSGPLAVGSILGIVFGSLFCCLIISVIICSYVRCYYRYRKPPVQKIQTNNVPMQVYVNQPPPNNIQPQGVAFVPVQYNQPPLTYPVCLVGTMDEADAEKELSPCNNGVYLLRYCEKQKGYVLSFKTGVNLYAHIGPIQQTPQGFVLLNLSTNKYDTYPSLEAVVQTLCAISMLTGPYK